MLFVTVEKSCVEAWFFFHFSRVSSVLYGDWGLWFRLRELSILSVDPKIVVSKYE